MYDSVIDPVAVCRCLQVVFSQVFGGERGGALSLAIARCGRCLCEGMGAMLWYAALCNRHVFWLDTVTGLSTDSTGCAGVPHQALVQLSQLYLWFKWH
jgi:hypothetical protein